MKPEIRLDSPDFLEAVEMCADALRSGSMACRFAAFSTRHELYAVDQALLVDAVDKQPPTGCPGGRYTLWTRATGNNTIEGCWLNSHQLHVPEYLGEKFTQVRPADHYALAVFIALVDASRLRRGSPLPAIRRWAQVLGRSDALPESLQPELDLIEGGGNG